MYFSLVSMATIILTAIVTLLIDVKSMFASEF